MPYIGTQPLTGQFKKLDAITVVNGQPAYTLNHNGAAYKPATANALLVSVNGVIQAAGDAFNISGSTITFTENLVTGDVIDFIIALGDTGSAVTPVDGSVTTAKIVDDAVTAAKLATGAAASNLGTSINLATIKDSTGNNTAITIDSSGDLTFNGSNTASVSDSGWITATLLNSYTHYNTTTYGPIRYRKIGSIVNIQGLTGQATASSTIFNLPVGYRPPNHLIFLASNYNNVGRLDIKQNGDVVPASAPVNNWFSVSCTFMVA